MRFGLGQSWAGPKIAVAGKHDFGHGVRHVNNSEEAVRDRRPVECPKTERATAVLIAKQMESLISGATARLRISLLELLLRASA
jgi:hypothetical protein